MIHKFSQLNHINENVAEAKSFLKQLGITDANGHISPEEPYHKLKGVIADGYLGTFVKLLYNNLEKITTEDLIDFYNNMVTLKNKKKIIVDLSDLKPDYSHDKFVKLSTKTKEAVAELQRTDDIKHRRVVPGIIANIHPEFKEVISKVVPPEWYVILCIKKSGSTWVSDMHAELFWGSPKWCLKKPQYWNQYVLNDTNKESGNIQYVLIHKDFFNQVAESGQFGDKTEHVDRSKFLVPINYGNDHASADKYSDENYDKKRRFLRIGVTTTPSKEKTFFSPNNQSIMAFDDANGNLSGEVSKFIEKTNFPIIMLDIVIRKALGYPRSEWDVTIPSIEEIMNFGKIDQASLNKIADEDDRSNAYIGKITESCNNIVKILNKVINVSAEAYSNIQKQIVPYLTKNSDQLPVYFWLLMFADNIPSQFFKKIEDLEEEGILSPGPVMYALQFACYFKEKNINEQYLDWLKKFTQRVLGHIMKGSMKDHDIKAPKDGRGLDFKTTLTTVYRNKSVYTEASKIDHLSDATKQLTVKLMASFIFVHLNEFGWQIIVEEGWRKLTGLNESVQFKIKRFKQI
jgi:hypothetical protein